MKPLNYFAVAAQQVATHPVALLKLEATLNSSAAAGLFLQIHNSAVVPAEGAAPFKCWTAAECAYKEFKRGELNLPLGCYICLSTTSATKTLSADLCDVLSVELTDPETPTGTTAAGDLTTSVTGLQVWADAAGPKRLIALEVNGAGLSTVCYLQLFAKDSPANGDVPVHEIKIAATANLTGANGLRFGANGRDMFSIDANGAHDGCTVKISTTPGVLTLTTDSAKIKAEYK